MSAIRDYRRAAGQTHARMFAALMEAQDHPFLYYEATEGGHVASANLRGVALEQTLEMTYPTERLHRHQAQWQLVIV